MKTVLIAGAGHGGLTAAIEFAKKGYRVTILERGVFAQLGYEWHDAMDSNTFTATNIPVPDLPHTQPGAKMCYFSTNKKTKIVCLRDPSKTTMYVDRRELFHYLVDCAEQAGVTLLEHCEVLQAVCDGQRVTGIRYRHDGETRVLRGDLIVDAAGMDSPLRRSLPESFGIDRDMEDGNVFYAWRGYFAKTDTQCSEPPHNIYFFHCGTPGMDWALTREEFVDILIGGFIPLTENTILAHLADFRADYPNMTETLLQGGNGIYKIPLGQTLPLFVANGYAAVGNAASMTEPLSGSGINLSMCAGKLLADTVIEAGGRTDIGVLWGYEYKYMQKFARKMYSDLIIRQFLTSLSAKDVDYMFDKRILTAKEFGGSSSGYSLRQLLQKASLLCRASLRSPLADALRRMRILSALRSTIPEQYNEKAVHKWVELYRTVFSDK